MLDLYKFQHQPLRKYTIIFPKHNEDTLSFIKFNITGTGLVFLIIAPL